MMYHTSKGELGRLTSFAEKKKTTFALALPEKKKQFVEKKKQFAEGMRTEQFRRGGGFL